VRRSSIESNDSVTALDTDCPLLAGVAGCVNWASKSSKLIGVAFDDPLPAFMLPEERQWVAEGTLKGRPRDCPLTSKGCPFTRRDCPFTRRDRAKGLSLHAKGCAEGAGSQRFSVEFMRYEHAQTAPVSAEECACMCSMMCSHSSACCSTQHLSDTHRLDNA